MRASKFSEVQKAFSLKQDTEVVLLVADICRKARISQAAYCKALQNIGVTQTHPKLTIKPDQSLGDDPLRGSVGRRF